MKLGILLSVLLLAGCASYKYEHVYEGGSCTISTSSMRDFQGLAFGVNENCAIKSEADTVDSTTALIELMAGVLRVIQPVE